MATEPSYMWLIHLQTCQAALNQGDEMQCCLEIRFSHSVRQIIVAAYAQ
jgi:hypothetical protein